LGLAFAIGRSFAQRGLHLENTVGTASSMATPMIQEQSENASPVASRQASVAICGNVAPGPSACPVLGRIDRAARFAWRRACLKLQPLAAAGHGRGFSMSYEASPQCAAFSDNMHEGFERRLS